MKIAVFSDRDGTINKDENYYLGSNPHWKEQVSFLEGVVEGIQLINKIPNSHFFILTNQSGVALQGGNFDNLTVERMHEVNLFILTELHKNGCNITGYFACPFVDENYALKAIKKGKIVNPKFVVNNHPDFKPNTGMIQKALSQMMADEGDYRIYAIGDRASDVEMSLNAGGIGILVESSKTKELGDVEKVLKMGKDAHVARDYLSAAQIIDKDIKTFSRL
ncbi:MAG: HAD hydrolase-like protein [Nanoarchaeota archaeon]|nr:HAD hydrolase-like protein [Nanoarchaeota archaeon]